MSAPAPSPTPPPIAAPNPGRPAAAPAPAPAPDEDRDHHGAREEPHERQEPRQPVEALTGRRRENRRAELRDELVLDLALGDAGSRSCLDEALDVARDRRVRLIERRLALRAHHLALEVRERRAGRGRGAGEDQCGDNHEQESHAVSNS